MKKVKTKETEYEATGEIKSDNEAQKLHDNAPTLTRGAQLKDQNKELQELSMKLL